MNGPPYEKAKETDPDGWIAAVPPELAPKIAADLLGMSETMLNSSRKNLSRERSRAEQRKRAEGLFSRTIAIATRIFKGPLRLVGLDQTAIALIIRLETFLFRDFRRLLRDFRRLFRDFRRVWRGAQISPEALSLAASRLYDQRGLPAALSHIFENASPGWRLSKTLENMAEVLFERQEGESLRVFWLAYAAGPEPSTAERIAKKIFKLGNISSAEALLRLASSGENQIDSSVARPLAEIRMSASVRTNGLNIPPRTGEIKLRPLSVAYVASSALPLQMAGYTVRTQCLLAALKSKGVNAHCYTRPGYPWDRRDILFSDADSKENLSLDSVDYTLTQVEGIEFEPEDFIYRMARALEERFRARMPAIVHAASNHRTGLPALIAARRVQLPFFYEMRGLWELTAATSKPHWENTQRFKLERSLELLVATEADHVFTITQGLANELISTGVPADKITLLPNAVDSKWFKPLDKDQALARRMGLQDDDFVLVYVGSLTPYEGLDDLIEAIGILRQKSVSAKLIIVGNGKIRHELQSIVANLKLQHSVNFHDAVPHDEARNFLALADVVALPRKPFKVCRIVTPLKPFEAMAMEKPLVLSDLPALREIVVDRVTGRLCRAGDAKDLADILYELANDPTEMLKLGKAARSWVSEHRSWDSTADILTATYGRFVLPRKEGPLPCR